MGCHEVDRHLLPFSRRIRQIEAFQSLAKAREMQTVFFLVLSESGNGFFCLSGI